jgi:putative toxin-antitoxin system antitoxin component (TIGR02293 family)
MKTGTLERKPSHVARAEHPHELIRRIQKGLPFRQLEELQKNLELPLEQLAEKLSISRATLHRRKVAGRLSPDESDKVNRYAELFTHALKVFGSIEKARAWLKFPQWGLGRIIPLDYAKTEVGAREVDNLLGRIDYGVYS